MRVLFITQRLPARSARGDQCRAFAHIRALSQRHRITSLSFSSAGAAERAALQPYCEDVIVLPRSRLRAAVRVLAALRGIQPLQVALHADAGRELDLAALRGRGFELVHVQLARLAPVLDEFAPLPRVLDFVDALSLNMARRARYDRGPAGWLAALEAPRLRAVELAVSERYVTTVCAAADRAAIRSDARAPRLVRNGVDLDEFPFHRGQARAEEIVFVGNLGYFPNVDAACWFAAEVLPRLRRERPQLRLRLVGARPAQALRRLAAAQPNIELVGPVDKVQPYLARAAAAIAPLRAGSGQQFKLLEAMALGTPVVSSAQSAEAMGAVDGEHLLVADDAAAMSAALLRLLAQPELGQALALRARALVQAEYSWARSAQELEAVWQEAAAV
ncbi:glycosyltransferase [Tahibacter harae]|uniref:Glycosyltransferase n=1 Tax=Tahibacter harae TaxID=2963937 RepID=A0ABT1QU79_9GAMM|nr:glycosyltransferase [Tahibacter harae]MCQ4165831.1 glycosyltransferase [Tahibacter harae]